MLLLKLESYSFFISPGAGGGAGASGAGGGTGAEGGGGGAGAENDSCGGGENISCGGGSLWRVSYIQNVEFHTWC